MGLSEYNARGHKPRNPGPGGGSSSPPTEPGTAVLSVLCIKKVVFGVANPGWVNYTYLVQFALIWIGLGLFHWIVSIIHLQTSVKGGIYFGILNLKRRE